MYCTWYQGGSLPVLSGAQACDLSHGTVISEPRLAWGWSF
jgi:hypothetical protein